MFDDIPTCLVTSEASLVSGAHNQNLFWWHLVLTCHFTYLVHFDIYSGSDFQNNFMKWSHVLWTESSSCITRISYSSSTCTVLVYLDLPITVRCALAVILVTTLLATHSHSPWSSLLSDRNCREPLGSTLCLLDEGLPTYKTDKLRPHYFISPVTQSKHHHWDTAHSATLGHKV